MPENHTPSGPGGSQDQGPGESQEHSAEGPPQEGAPLPPGAPPQGAPPPPEPPQAAPPAGPQASDNSLMLILSYLGILGIIPLLVEKDEEVQWHAKNGIVLFLAMIAVGIAATVIGFIPYLGWILGCGMIPLATLGYLVLIVVGIMKALKGEKLRLPVIADLVDQW